MRCIYCWKIDSWDSPWDGLLRKWNGSDKKSFMFKHQSRSLHAKLLVNTQFTQKFWASTLLAVTTKFLFLTLIRMATKSFKIVFALTDK